MACGKRGTFIQHHTNIGTEQRLNFDAAFGRQHVITPVNMALEAHAIFAHLGKLRQRHHLKPAAIGKYWAIPLHELL